MKLTPVGSTYCPSGQCSTTNPAENIWQSWPEFEACEKSLDSEPMFEVESWWPISESTHAQCPIISGVTGCVFKLPKFSRGLVTPSCRHNFFLRPNAFLARSKNPFAIPDVGSIRGRHDRDVFPLVTCMALNYSCCISFNRNLLGLATEEQGITIDGPALPRTEVPVRKRAAPELDAGY